MSRSAALSLSKSHRDAAPAGPNPSLALGTDASRLKGSWPRLRNLQRLSRKAKESMANHSSRPA